jgi:hypothetical protein
VRTKELLDSVKEDRNVIHTINRRKANWIGHILRFNCLLKHIIERKIEGRIEVVTVRRSRRRNQLLGDLNEKRGFFKLKREAIVRTLWKNRCGRFYGSVVIQSTECMRVM